MSDSKLNKELHDAARTGVRKVTRSVRSTLKNMRFWQKTGLVLCVLFWIASVILRAVCGRITGGLKDQDAAARWSRNGEYAQISCFMAEGSGASEDTVKAMYSGLMTDLQEAAVGLSETQIENGAKLINECFCGMGSADLAANGESVTVNAIGVGGDFFNFHPLDLIDGYYFAEDELMHDRIVIDDQTAWRLFGSPYVVGMSVNIGGTPHYIAGVFRQSRKRFYKDSGMGSYLVFMSYDSLCKYTDSASYGEGSGGNGGDNGMDLDRTDALAPEKAPASGRKASETSGIPADDPSIPQTAAYRTPISENFPQKRGTLSESADETDAGEDTEDTGEKETKEEKTEEEVSDDPIEGNSGNPGNPGRGYGNNRDDGDDDSEEEVNRSRVTCYETVMPNPVPGFAVSKVRSRLEQSSFPMEMVTIVDNTSRFDVLRLVAMLGQPGVRSMQTAPIRYPYWENVALAWEDVMIPYALLWMILRYSPIAFLLWLLIWYATHKSWTVGGIVQTIRDRIYDRESEKIYGKSSGAALPVSGPDESGTALLPAESTDDTGAETESPPEENTAAAEAEGTPGAENTADGSSGADTGQEATADNASDADVQM